jgi:hypothetical protein
MKVNDKLPFFIRDVYLYDIEACHYTILQKIGYDMSQIDKDDKLKRNIQIGMLMKKNPQLTNLLRGTTASVIDEFIKTNFIKEDEILLRQYDGIITTRTLKVTDTGHIKLEMRKHFEIFIVSIDRTKYLSLDNTGAVTIKGLAYKYPEMENILSRLCKIRFANKVEIFTQLQKIRELVLHSKNPTLFAIPIKENIYHIFFKDYGEMEIKKPMLSILDTDDIDKEKYFKIYLEPFTKSIVLENLR